jgi:hypothetical protein
MPQASPCAGSRGSQLVFDRGWLGGIVASDRRLDVPSREPLHQHPMDEHVAAADFAEEYLIRSVVQEARVVPGRKAFADEPKSQCVMLEVGSSSRPQRERNPTRSSD